MCCCCFVFIIQTDFSVTEGNKPFLVSYLYLDQRDYWSSPPSRATVQTGMTYSFNCPESSSLPWELDATATPQNSHKSKFPVYMGYFHQTASLIFQTPCQMHVLKANSETEDISPLPLKESDTSRTAAISSPPANYWCKGLWYKRHSCCLIQSE